MAKLTIDYLRECFDYDPDTGVLTWRVRPRNHFKTDAVWKISVTKSSGKPAGSRNPQGYLKVGVGGKRVLLHRVIWAMIKGIDLIDVPAELDHKNTIRDDNRESNLRAATRAQNTHNTGVSSNNTSGFKGVHFEKQHGFWRAKIMVNGKNHHLGLFNTVEDAAKARAAAQVLHGDFARLSANDNTPLETAA